MIAKIFKYNGSTFTLKIEVGCVPALPLEQCGGKDVWFTLNGSAIDFEHWVQCYNYEHPCPKMGAWMFWKHRKGLV